MNPSIVDYLNSQGQSSDFTTRANLAAAKGITNYTGTAQQNTQLLAALRGSGATPNTGATWTPVGPNGKPITYDPTGGTDLPTSPQQIAIAKNDPRTGEFPTYTTQGGATTYLSPDQVQSSYLQNLMANTPQTQQLTTPNVSPGQPGVGGIDGMIAYYKSLFDTNKQQQTDLQTQISNQKTIEGKQIEPYLQKIMNSPGRAQVEQNSWQQTGVNPSQYFSQEKAQIAEIQASTEKYNAAVAQRDAQIAQTQDKLGSMNFISNQIAQINRNAAPVLNQMSADINSKAAVLQATQGMFAEAQKYVNQAIDAATADLKYNFDMYTTLYNQNEDIIKGLDSKLQNAYTQKIQISEKAFTYAQDQKTRVGQLMLDNPQAGISIGSDSLDTAIEKVQRTPNPKIAANLAQQKANTDKTIAETNKIKNPTSTPTATEGRDLADAMAYMKANPTVSPDQVKQRFLQAHPSASAAWNNYFTAVDTTKQTYPKAPEAQSTMKWYDPRTWF